MKGNRYISDSEKKKAKQAKEKQKKARRDLASSKQAQSVVQIMNGDFLTKDFVINNLNFIFFVVFLLVLVVSKGYYVHSLANNIRKTEIEVGDLTSDYVETKAKLEEMTQRGQMVQKLEPLGLKEAVNPTKVIRIKDEDKK
ncbi:MAG TPA: FtsL-like putative cell division protein [Brumimicrobium sp.]|nr:FtsL-like putative cell division protein [Brumimicrobium sp.]